MKKILLGLCLALCIAGCTTYGTEIKDEQVSTIQKELTTRLEIINIFGQPQDSFTDSAGREVYRYEYKKLKATAKTFIPVVGIFHQESKADTRTLLVMFNKNDTVYDYKISDKKDELIKSGLIK